eukprot:GEMP01013458.1.p1 GENE.GEMP01013458.1~~GEMP01013458.1.p1  ORF type:complete len:672 (+),score=148.22 GEMP01013458.1:3-2018(+)
MNLCSYSSRRLAFRHFSTEVAATSARPLKAGPSAIPKPKSRGRWRYVALAGTAFVGWRMYDDYARKELRATRLRNTMEVQVPSRKQMVEDLKLREVDVLVIGGGATGCGVALDATTRGLSVACIEQEDFGSGTSSKSTKLFWGGSRYLIQATVELLSLDFFKDPVAALTKFADSFKMVLSCLRERNWMAEQQQHLTQWIPIVVPYDRWILWPNPPFDFYPAAVGPITGLFPLFFKLYDALGSFACPSSHMMSTATAKHLFPQLSAPDGADLKYLSVFFEVQHNDSRTNIAIALTAAMRGASMANYVLANSIIFDRVGKAIGCESVDKITGDKFTIRAKNIVFAGGAFTGGLHMLGAGGEEVDSIISGAGGTHIVLPEHFCPRNLGYVNMKTSDGRFLFYLPWMGHTLVGTTDDTTSEPELHTAPSERDIEWILNELKKYLEPSIQLQRSDVLAAWYGVRPLVSLGEDSSSTGASRDHYIAQDSRSKIWTIAGGKWTTYREMAEDALDQMCAEKNWVERGSKSCDVLLIGEGPVADCPKGWHKNVGMTLVNKYNLPHDVAEHLSRAYGTRAFELLNSARDDEKHRLSPEFPILEAEVRHAVKKEFAQTASDVLARRTRLAFLNVNACNAAIPRVCEIMGDELKWDASRVQREIENTKKMIAEEFIGSVSKEC